MDVNANSLKQGLERMASRSDVAIKEYLDTAGLKLQNYAKKNAPWTDRSGRARTSLNYSVEAIPVGYRLIIAHGVDYGIWLELAHEKRFAILDKTIQQNSSEIMKGFTNLMERLK